MRAGSMRNAEFEAVSLNAVVDALKVAESLIDGMATFEDKREYAVKLIREMKHEQRHLKKMLKREALRCIR